MQSYRNSKEEGSIRKHLYREEIIEGRLYRVMKQTLECTSICHIPVLPGWDGGGCHNKERYCHQGKQKSWRYCIFKAPWIDHISTNVNKNKAWKICLYSEVITTTSSYQRACWDGWLDNFCL